MWLLKSDKYSPSYAVNNLRIKNKPLYTGNIHECKSNRFRQKEKKESITDEATLSNLFHKWLIINPFMVSTK